MLSQDSLAGEVLAGPDYYLHKLDLLTERALFVRLSRAQFAAASFLDDRVLTRETQGAWHELAELSRALQGATFALPLHFIFHMGHTGSTLLSRLIESAGGTLALREPLPLRALAEAWDDVGAAHALWSEAQLSWLMRMQIGLWRRGYADTRAVVLKATSATARLASVLLTQAPDMRCVFLHLKPEPYLATLLAGENSWIDLRGLAPERMRRLTRMSGAELTPLHKMSLGELAAMSWACETLTRAHACAVLGDRALALDFESLLEEPSVHAHRVFEQFSLQAPPDFFANAARSPVFQRYAKAPDAPYSPAQRRQMLDETRRLRAAEIAAGLAWIGRFARHASHVAHILERSA